MNDLFISTTTFGASDKTPLNKLEQAGISYSLNPHKRKLLPAETAVLAKDCRAKMEMEAVDEVIRYIKGKPLKQEVSI
jgi:hypothetical protein